jgi:hypothetical protein
LEQVPRTRAAGPLRYGLIGRGRFACHLAFYWQSLGIPFRHWHRGLSTTPEDTLQNTDVLALAISDAALEPFLDSYPQLSNRTLVHFSGAHVSERAIGLHPLSSFSPTLFAPEVYPTIPFIGERGRPGLREVFPAFTNPFHVIAPEDKPRYHAACVLGGNFSTLLWTKFRHELEALGIPGDAGMPYMKAIFENLQRSPEQALTGPLARKDVRTIQRNLSALGSDPYANVYAAFLRAEFPDFFRQGGETP